MKTTNTTITVNWTYDNRDSVTVKNAPCEEIAANYAAEFINDIDDPESDYALDVRLGCEDDGQDEYTFRVKCYDK